jgi:hypothetical protein
MAALLSLSFLAGSIGFIFWRKAIVQHLNLTVILGLFGSTFIMLTAPGLRFGLGYLILVPAWILAVLCSHLSIVQRILTFLNHAIARLVHSSKMRYLPYLCLGCILTISVAYPPLRQQIVLPPPLPDANVAEAQINNIEYTYTDTDEVLCWAMPQPCAIGPIEANIQLRYPNRGLGAGFEYAQR